MYTFPPSQLPAPWQMEFALYSSQCIIFKHGCTSFQKIIRIIAFIALPIIGGAVALYFGITSYSYCYGIGIPAIIGGMKGSCRYYNYLRLNQKWPKFIEGITNWVNEKGSDETESRKRVGNCLIEAFHGQPLSVCFGGHASSYCGTITTLPKEILNLPVPCRVYVGSFPLSRDTLENIREWTSAKDYYGPTFETDFLGSRGASGQPLYNAQDIFDDLQAEFDKLPKIPLHLSSSSSRKRDPYEVLGLKRSDSPSQRKIKRAYMKFALQYHPDKNVNHPDQSFVTARFREGQEAYETLRE